MSFVYPLIDLYLNISLDQSKGVQFVSDVGNQLSNISDLFTHGRGNRGRRYQVVLVTILLKQLLRIMLSTPVDRCSDSRSSNEFSSAGTTSVYREFRDSIPFLFAAIINTLTGALSVIEKGVLDVGTFFHTGLFREPHSVPQVGTVAIYTETDVVASAFQELRVDENPLTTYWSVNWRILDELAIDGNPDESWTSKEYPKTLPWALDVELLAVSGPLRRRVAFILRTDGMFWIPLERAGLFAWYRKWHRCGSWDMCGGYLAWRINIGSSNDVVPISRVSCNVAVCWGHGYDRRGKQEHHNKFAVHQFIQQHSNISPIQL